MHVFRCSQSHFSRLANVGKYSALWIYTLLGLIMQETATLKFHIHDLYHPSSHVMYAGIW